MDESPLASFKITHASTCSGDVHTCAREQGIPKSTHQGFALAFRTKDPVVAGRLPESDGKPTASWAAPPLLANSGSWTVLLHNAKICIQINSSSALEQLRTNLPPIPRWQLFKYFKPMLTSPKSLCFSRLSIFCPFNSYSHTLSDTAFPSLVRIVW